MSNLTPNPEASPQEGTGPEHRAVPVLTPSRAFWRTVLQVGPASALALLGFLPPAIQIVLDGFGRHLPGEMYAWLAGAAVVITAASATIARLMALAKAQELIKKLFPKLAYKEVSATE